MTQEVPTTGRIVRDRCPVCDSADIGSEWRIPFATIPPTVVGSGTTTVWASLDPAAEVVEFARCSTCRSVFRSPYPSAKAGYAQSTYHVDLAGDEGRRKQYASQYARHISPCFQPTYRRFLEAGCGSGQYLFAAADDAGRRWNRLVGVDLSQPSVAFIREKSAGKIEAHAIDIDLPGALDGIAKPCEFDFIALSEVFEHLDSPRQAMRNLLGVLRSGGRLFFTAQSCDGKLPIRPGEPILASRDGLAMLLQWLGVEVVRYVVESGRFKVVVQR